MNSKPKNFKIDFTVSETTSASREQNNSSKLSLDKNSSISTSDNSYHPTPQQKMSKRIELPPINPRGNSHSKPPRPPRQTPLIRKSFDLKKTQVNFLNNKVRAKLPKNIAIPTPFNYVEHESNDYLTPVSYVFNDN